MADTPDIFSFVAADEAATLRCAAWLAQAVGDETGLLISLEGDLGAGKTAFARGFLQTRLGADTLVPSPSFSLIQPYEDTNPPFWHVDLYRLSDASEVEELGLLDIMHSHICLMEWAERADDILPPPQLRVALMPLENDARQITITAPHDMVAALQSAAARDAALGAFLHSAAWGHARRFALAGDASTRRYERLETSSGETAVLMDWAKGPDGPPIHDGKPYSQVAHLAEAMPAYCAMVDWLADHALAAPALLARDEAQGFALMEDFGDRHIAADETIDRAVFYHEAVATLVHLHQTPPAPHLAAYDGDVQAVEAGLFLDWYLPWRGIEISATGRDAFLTYWHAIGNALAADHPVTVLRDYHSVNLLWREGAQARFRIGLIDVQDALKGHAAYDVASLLCDARVDVASDIQHAGLLHYKTARFGEDISAHKAFDAAYMQCLMQRNLKIAGIFIRLAARDQKPGYLRHIPRVLGYLRHALAHDALADMADWFSTYAPEALEPSDD